MRVRGHRWGGSAMQDTFAGVERYFSHWHEGK